MFADASKLVPLLSYTPCHEDLLESGGIDPVILNLGIRLRCIVSSMFQRVYPQCPWVGPRTGMENGERHQSCTLLEKKTPVSQPSP